MSIQVSHNTLFQTALPFGARRNTLLVLLHTLSAHVVAPPRAGENYIFALVSSTDVALTVATSQVRQNTQIRQRTRTGNAVLSWHTKRICRTHKKRNVESRAECRRRPHPNLQYPYGSKNLRQLHKPKREIRESMDMFYFNLSTTSVNSYTNGTGPAWLPSWTLAPIPAVSNSMTIVILVVTTPWTRWNHVR